jgi:hypothetical protein
VAQHTYLDLVNKVLVNLRETAGQTQVNATPYSTLIGEFVNQAKETVEDSWQWSALTSELQFTTVLQQTKYFLDAAANSPAVTLIQGRNPDERSFVLKDDRNYDMCFDTTLVSSLVLYQLTAIPRERATGDLYLGNSRTASNPYLFSYTWELDQGSGVMRPTFYMVNPPVGSRIINMRMFVPQPEMIPGTNETTAILVPWRPIVSLATALAMQERGEELGQSADLYFTRYNAELLRAQETDRLASKQRFSDQLIVEELGQNNWSLD